MFKEATKQKLRFNTVNGVLAVEDVWDLPLTSQKKASLDSLAKDLNRQLKATEEESFVETPTRANATLQLKFEVVKAIIKERIAERDAKRDAADRKARRELLNGVISRKQHAALEDKSLEELEAERDAL